MDVLGTTYIPGDTRLIDQIVYELKSQGIFDQFRKECIADVDTKPAYQNLRQRVEGSVSGFLRKQIWRPDMNKNQVREMLRKSLQESGFLETGVERIVDQVVNPKINSVFLPKVEDVVYRFLGIEKPQRNEKLSSTQLRLNALNLLPTDLEAVSPESDMNDDFMDDEKSADKIDNGVGEKVETGNGDVSKMEDEESPPFEPLEEQPAFIPQEENSVDSHVSGFSGLASHDSNHSQDLKSTQMEISTQDSQPSKHSSDGNFSSAISDDNDSKLEICEDSHLSKSSKSHDSNSTFEINNHVDKNSKDGKLEVPKTEEKKDEGKKSESSRHDEKKESSKHEDKKHDKSKSSSSSSKHKSSRSDRKDDKDRKSDKKDHKDRHSSSKNHEKKDSKSSSSRSDKDKESKSSKEKTDREKESKSDKEKESKNDKEKESKNDKEKESKSDKDKENKERDKSKDRNKSSSSKHSSSSSRDKSSSRKDSHSKDRSSDKSKSSNKDSKPKEEKSKSHESSSQTDKHKHSHSDRRSSSSNHKDKKDGDKSKKRESKDDHYSSKLKKRERRSTDRDSSDGHSDFKSSSSNNQVVKQSEQKETSAVNSGGDSSNSEPTESEQHQHTSLVMEVQPEVQHKIKLIKPKFASNIHEARRLMKIRKQLDKIEKRSQLAQDLAINNPVLISQIQGSFNLVEAMSLESENISPENHKKQPNILKKSPIRIEIPKPKTPEKPKSPELVSPPLQNSVITMESWDALEAKFNEKLMNSAYGSYGDYGEEECDMDEYRKGSVCEEVEKKEESVTKDAPVENFETEKMEESSFQNKVQGEVVTEPDKVEQPSEISLNTEILTEQINEAPEIVEDNAEAKEVQPRIDTAKPEDSVPISEPSAASKDIESEETHLEPLKTQEEPVVKPAELEEHLEEPGQSSTEQNPLLDLHFKSPDDCASFEHSLLPQSRRYLAFAADRIKHLEESIEHMSAITNRLTPMSPAVGVKRKRKDRAVDTQNNNKRQNRQSSEMERMNRNNINKKTLKGVNTVIQNESFSLPLSPAESDNSIDKKVEIVEKVTVAKTKPASHKKESQRYSSDDLYKPRPLITGSRRRGVRVENVQ